MKTVFLFASVSLASGLLLTNIYNSLIDARSWGADIPQSVATAREYFKLVTPGNFYRLFSPANQLLALLSLILLWSAGATVRWYLGFALLLYVIADVLTFAYFYPRNEIIFKPGAVVNIPVVKAALQQWSIMNWVRSLVLLAGIVLSFLSVHQVYSPR